MTGLLLFLAATTATPGEVRLTPQQVDAVLDAAAAKREAAEQAQPKRPVQGEVSFAIGTDGYRAAYGTVVAPLAGDGYAAFTFDTVNFDHPRRR